MLVAGDEFGRTQGGNNNAYCQDDEISWLNWDLEEKGKSLIRFVQQLAALRHRYPILRRNLFLKSEFNEELGVKDLAWINANGSEMTQDNWADLNMRCFGMLLDGRAQPSGIRQRGREVTLLIVINGHHDLVNFTLPVCPDDGHEHEWVLLVDTNRSDLTGDLLFAPALQYGVTGRSVLVFEMK